MFICIVFRSFCANTCMKFLMFILANTCMCFPFLYLRNFLFLCVSTYAALVSSVSGGGGILFMHISLFLCAYVFAVIVCFVHTYWWSFNLAWLSSSIRLFYHDFLIFVLCLLWVLCQRVFVLLLGVCVSSVPFLSSVTISCAHACILADISYCH